MILDLHVHTGFGSYCICRYLHKVTKVRISFIGKVRVHIQGI